MVCNMLGGVNDNFIFYCILVLEMCLVILYGAVACVLVVCVWILLFLFYAINKCLEKLYLCSWVSVILTPAYEVEFIE